MTKDEQVLAELQKQLAGENLVHQRMKIKNDEMFELTVRQLKAACASNPNHEHSKIFENAMLGAGDDEKLVVSKVDLEAVLLNKKVRIERGTEVTVEGGRQVAYPVETKYLED